MEIALEVIETFRPITLFQSISNDTEALNRIASLFIVKQYGAGSMVIREGETGDAMYIIKSGEVEIVKKTSAGDSYTVAKLSSNKHMFFGEMALIDDDKRSAGVVCKTDCDFYVLTRDKFYSLGDANPAIGLAITRELSKIVCNRLRKANGDIITLFDALVGEVVESGGLS